MITIPIWLFVTLVTLSSLLIIALGVALIGYIRVCQYEKQVNEIHICKK